MELKEIKERANFIRKDLPMGVWMNQKQLCWLADIDAVRMWRLPADEKPRTFRMGNAEVIEIDAAIRWADDFWRRQEAKKARSK